MTHEPLNPPPPAAADPRSSATTAPQWFLVLTFVFIIGSVPLVQWGIDALAGESGRLGQVFRQRPTSAHLRAFEHDLEEASLVARALRPLIQFLQLCGLGDGGEKALVGRQGWLFYKPGYDVMVARDRSPGAAAGDASAAIVAWREALAARGIELLVVPVPNKESIYPDRLTRRVRAGQVVVSDSTRTLLLRLREAGVHYVDLFAVFAQARRDADPVAEDSIYLAQDSHWSPAGLALAARAVAARLRELGWTGPGENGFEERPVDVRRLGDVLRMFQSERIERAFPPEAVRCSQIVHTGDGRLYRDDPHSEVLVIGDSFLRIFERDEPGSAGFIAHLARELRRPVASLVNDGGASTLVRQELFRRPALLAGKRVVVWEFVERDIRLGTEGWQHVPLPPANR